MVSKISPQKIGDILIFEKSWDDLVKLITPLDLVLFSGSDLVSSAIQKLEKQKLSIHQISHVGIVVSSSIFPKIKQLNPTEWYVWESTSSLRLPGFENEVLDIFGKEKLGVQIRNLKDVFQIYKGKVYIGKLIQHPLITESNYCFDSILKTIKEEIDHMNLQFRDLEKYVQDSNQTLTSKEQIIIQDEMDLVRQHLKSVSHDHLDRWTVKIEDDVRNVYLGSKKNHKIMQDLRWLYELYGNRMYNASFLDLLSALFPVLRPLRSMKYKMIRRLAKVFKSKKMTEESLFCSQFVALVYQKLGIIDPKMNPADFVPVDFLGCDQDGQPNLVSLIFEITCSNKNI
jgi:hypothetical protein